MIDSGASEYVINEVYLLKDLHSIPEIEIALAIRTKILAIG